MAKMNKSECINFIVEKMKEQDEKRKSAKTMKEYISFDCFEECEKVCAENGYTKDCFSDLWTRATRIIAIVNGVYRP